MLVRNPDSACVPASPPMWRRISERSSAMPSPVTAEVDICAWFKRPSGTRLAASAEVPAPKRWAIFGSPSGTTRSDLLVTIIAGRVDAWSTSASSSRVIGCEASRTTSTKSASASASIDLRMPIDSASSRASRMPAVSTSLTGMPPIATVSLTRSRVVPGVAVTMARSRSTRRLNKLDLPTFGRPTIASVNPS